MSYAIDIVMVIIIFLFILTIIINILNYRIVKRRHYIELIVDKKLPIEAESRDAGASDDSCMIYHYPVEGRDSTSGYASIFYIGNCIIDIRIIERHGNRQYRGSMTHGTIS